MFQENIIWLTLLAKNILDIKDLSKIITKFVKSSKKEVILFIDEVDKSSNNQIFLSFIGMLRNKYLARESGRDFTFKSVILVGLYDVKKSWEKDHIKRAVKILIDEKNTLFDTLIKNLENDKEFKDERIEVKDKNILAVYV